MPGGDTALQIPIPFIQAECVSQELDQTRVYGGRLILMRDPHQTVCSCSTGSFLPPTSSRRKSTFAAAAESPPAPDLGQTRDMFITVARKAQQNGMECV